MESLKQAFALDGSMQENQQIEVLMSDKNKKDETISARDEFNRTGMRLYATITAIPVSLGICFFSLGKYLKPEASEMLLAGVIFGALGAAGGVYETYRLVKESAKSHSESNDDPDPPPSEPKP